MTGSALAVSLVGQALAHARGLFSKSAIKQVDRLLSNAGVVPWELFGSWVREVVGERREIVVAMDWTDFDADNQSTLALHLGMDRLLRTSTVKRRVHSLFRQGCLLYDLIPNMPEARLRPLIEQYAELLRQNASFAGAFGIT